MSQTCLVTGGAVRVGRAIVLDLAQRNYDVVVHYNASTRAAEETASEVEALGQRARVVQADLSRPDEVRRLATTAEEAFGRLDVLVNSASTYIENPLTDVSVAEWDHVMAVNVRAPFLLTQSLAPLLHEARGCVVNLVDLSAFTAWTSYPHHSVSKAALLHLTRVQARSMAPGVRVNAIAPGYVLPPDGDSPEAIEASRKAIPMGRIGDPADVVQAVGFLIGAAYVTGEVVVVDGGRSLVI